VRINLSEQTDLSDLMGSDLPVPEKNADGKLQASFKWCDGVLLTAIKNGDWVLLDELNLASQAVLEGLNSCLDYRASVFVPELGKTFDCPSTFRVFGAQNGMAEGGGRKGLPRSFLNRCKQLMMFVLIEKCLARRKPHTRFNVRCLTFTPQLQKFTSLHFQRAIFGLLVRNILVWSFIHASGVQSHQFHSCIAQSCHQILVALF